MQVAIALLIARLCWKLKSESLYSAMIAKPGGGAVMLATPMKIETWGCDEALRCMVNDASPFAL